MKLSQLDLWIQSDDTANQTFLQNTILPLTFLLLFQNAPSLQQIVEGQCIWLLERDGEPDFTRSFQLLESLHGSQGGAVCLKVCENLLARLTKRRNVLFVAEFVLESLREELKDERVTGLVHLCVGCRVRCTLMVLNWLRTDKR